MTPAPQRQTQIDPAGEPLPTPEQILASAAQFAADRKALDIVALDLRGVVGYADYLLIATGRSDRQAKAIHDAIHAGLKRGHRLLPRRVEGFTEGRWVLLDYLDVVVHVFTPETREHYRLEQLWGESPRVELDLDLGAPAEADVEPDEAPIA